MVCSVDDGPKTDWLILRPLRSSLGLFVIWCKLGIKK